MHLKIRYLRYKAFTDSVVRFIVDSASRLNATPSPSFSAPRSVYQLEELAVQVFRSPHVEIPSIIPKRLDAAIQLRERFASLYRCTHDADVREKNETHQFFLSIH